MTDDDGGTASSSLTKSHDDCDCTKSQSFWKKRFKERIPKDTKKDAKGQFTAEDTPERLPGHRRRWVWYLR